MIDFIVHEKSVELKSCYEMIILNFLGNREEKFKIFEYDTYIKKHYGRNIYILSSENFDETLEIANKIRNANDWHSQIIIISNFANVNKELLNNKLLILDYIEQNENTKERLKESLCLAYKIIGTEKTLNFILNGEIHKIPYRDILYIEKGNNQNHCTIFTMDKEYIIKDTIKSLESQLDQAFFLKTHRSCIVNLDNIKYYNCYDNIINFENNKIDLIARERRQILKSKLISDKITN